MHQQTTIANTVAHTGIGLHSGCEVTIRLQPAPADTGLVFVRTDLPGNPKIPAVSDSVTSTMRATTIGNNEVKVFTIEHLLSAFHVLQVDNCFIEINAEEPPVTDGSSLVFFDLIKQAGLQQQDKLRREIVIDKVYRIDDGDRFVMVVPYDGFRVSFTSLNPHKLIGVQYEDFIIDEQQARTQVAPMIYDSELLALYRYWSLEQRLAHQRRRRWFQSLALLQYKRRVPNRWFGRQVARSKRDDRRTRRLR